MCMGWRIKKRSQGDDQAEKEGRSTRRNCFPKDQRCRKASLLMKMRKKNPEGIETSEQFRKKINRDSESSGERNWKNPFHQKKWWGIQIKNEKNIRKVLIFFFLKKCHRRKSPVGKRKKTKVRRLMKKSQEKGSKTEKSFCLNNGEQPSKVTNLF